jgi:hypothetical protein
MLKHCALAAFAASLPFTAHAQKATDVASAVRHPAAVTIASAILPGTGQAMLRQKRSVLYLALEAAGLAYYFSRHNRGVSERRLYRRISRDVARAQFSPAGPEGDWDYYERMEKYVESGEFDRVAGGAIDPESNEETFNGAMWLLARQTFWRDPASPPSAESAEYRAALEFYVSRAVKPEYRWSWSGDSQAFQQFRSAIASSNSAFRDAEQVVSLVLANHFLSAVDAYTSVRLRVRRTANDSTFLIASYSF